MFYFSYASGAGWYWNVTVLADDGFISVMQIMMDNFHTAAAVIQVAILWFVFTHLPGLDRQPTALPGSNSPASWLRSPWLWVSIPAMGAAFISALKVGGNAGNTQLGLILLLPLVHYLFRKVNRRLFIALAWCAVISHLTTLYVGPASYLEARRLKSFLQNEVSVQDGLVLTGSNVYFASRVLADKAQVVNYWALDLRNNVDPGSADSLPELLQRMQPEILIVENWPQNRAAIQGDARYRMIFENSVGLVASRGSR